MSVASGYYDEGEYSFITLDRGRENLTVEVVTQTMKHPRYKLAMTRAVISKDAKKLLKEKLEASKIKLIKDESGDSWLKISGPDPELAGLKTMSLSRTVHFYRIQERTCQKDHDHDNTCVKVKYPYVPRVVEQKKPEKKEEKKEEKPEKKEEKSRRSSKRSV